MRVVNYNKNRWGAAVADLFASIYPDWDTQQCNRMAYDETHPWHVLTLLAVEGCDLVGQINIFRVGESAEMANVGYHVHPHWHRKGVASLLLSGALAKITNIFSDGLVIQTNESNIASIALARKLGFVELPKEIFTYYCHSLKFHSVDDGVCFHLPCAKTTF
ncbi:hypothetical protein AHAT_16950 [Agarivorans sp. Toyoura001]|uniref:GNAT family N-acetyltransferase n=1 Tax=Agarivorans sp. Toyoura001 TaxID=2283141 RepID=UPI0010EC63E3|nr:GNAT family N-acetyltransferase [Agarivorans sp. Toyoura001]GDY25805.1 hypothetical protein AHAT_16950 [Agarivorans sp. Toyoura001]